MTIDQLRGFLAFMVKNNTIGVQNALSSLGYSPATTGSLLVEQLMGIYQDKGQAELEKITALVIPNKASTNDSELAAIRETLTGEPASTAKFSFTDFLTIWSGSIITTGGTSTTTKQPALDPGVVIAVVAVVAVVLFVFGYLTLKD